MKRIGLFLVFVVVLCSCGRQRQIKFLQLNIWQEGTVGQRIFPVGGEDVKSIVLPV